MAAGATIIALLGGMFKSAASTAKEAYGPYLPAGGVPINQNDLDVLARTLWGEARSLGYSGMQSVANVIMNRVKSGKYNPLRKIQFGSGVSGVCQKKAQFSCWNPRYPDLLKAAQKNDPTIVKNYQQLIAVTTKDQNFAMATQIAESALRGTLPDITKNAVFYHTVSIKPVWARGVTPIARVGSHVFYNEKQIA